MKMLFVLTTIVTMLWVAGCQRNAELTPAQGTLTGTVTIGPLCPVEPCTLTDKQRDTIYGAYTLAFRRTDTQAVEAVINNLDHTGAYTITLHAGAYTVICEQCLQKNVIPSFIIPANQITHKDLSIDTGIR